MTKFKQGQKVLYNDEEYEVKVARKDFSNNNILYQLKDGPKDVAEEDLKKVTGRSTPSKSGKKGKGKKEESPELITAREEYTDLIGEVPSNMKNNLEWLQTKVKEAKDAADTGGDTTFAQYNALAKLDRDGLAKIIEEKALEIEVDDYEDDSELLIAVCEGLEVEIPEQDEE